jgi:hypothetical protein
MCKRSEAKADPLVNTFLERYHLNLLAIPRQNADVGDLYIHDGKHTAPSGKLAAFLAKPFQLPVVTRGETMAAVTGTVSRSVKTEVGLGLLESFLLALGATLPLGEVKAHWQTNGARTLRFKLLDAKRDSLDVGQLGLALIDNILAANHPLIDQANRYYLVTGVARSPSLTVAFENDQGNTLDLGVDLIGMGNAGVGVTITRGATGEVTFAGAKSLAFGLELYELYVLGERIRLRMPDSAINVRAAGTPGSSPQPAFIGSDDADVFIYLAKEG